MHDASGGTVAVRRHDGIATALKALDESTG
jgi:hypothetical protein